MSVLISQPCLLLLNFCSKIWLHTVCNYLLRHNLCTANSINLCPSFWSFKIQGTVTSSVNRITSLLQASECQRLLTITRYSFMTHFSAGAIWKSRTRSRFFVNGGKTSNLFYSIPMCDSMWRNRSLFKSERVLTIFEILQKGYEWSWSSKSGKCCS